MTAGQFTFLYTDHEGKAHTVTNRADGSIDLPILTLSQAGTYTFQLAEAQAMTASSSMTRRNTS